MAYLSSGLAITPSLRKTDECFQSKVSLDIGAQMKYGLNQRESVTSISTPLQSTVYT